MAGDAPPTSVKRSPSVYEGGLSHFIEYLSGPDLNLRMVNPSMEVSNNFGLYSQVTTPNKLGVLQTPYRSGLASSPRHARNKPAQKN